MVGWGSDLFGKLGTGRNLVRYSPGQVTGLPAITQVASYTYGFHIVARDASGRVWTWGQNDFGQLGPRAQRNASLPGRVQGLSDVVQVVATEQSSVALKNDGTVWVWGSGVFGFYAVPTRVEGLTGILQISGSFFHFFARRNDGTVWAVGWNPQNQLGVGAPSPIWNQYATPTQIPLPANVIDVSATILGGVARTGDGKVWSWGTSSWTEMGDALPREVTGFPAPPAKLVGETLHYHAVLADGSLWRWGNTAAPAQVPGFANVVRAGADSGQIDDLFDYVVVDTVGRMFVRSGNAYGERGNGTPDPGDASIITQVPSLTIFVDARWTQHCVIGVTATGQVWVWGAEVSGSYADGTVQTHPVPRSIAGVANIKQLAAGREFSAALDASGNVWFWGDNPGGVSGNDTFSPISTPRQVPISGVMAIAAGWAHLLMVKNDGSVWMTGYFVNAGYATPTQVPGLASIKTVAAGHESSFAIGTDGRLWAWGANDKGELGLGDTNPHATPTEVVVPGGVAKIAVEYKGVLAVSSVGDVYGWGEVDTRNMLGVESNPGDIVTSPQKVAGITNVVDVALGQFHYLARRGDGTVFSWGPDWQPEPLGRDTGIATPAHVPSPVLDLSAATAIAAANGASYSIRSDGTVWGWGLNWASGAGPTVGDGTFVRRPRPVVVIREDGIGNLETNDWFLDAKPGTAKTIPAGKVPKVIPLTKSLSSTGILNVDASLNVKVSDQAKTLGLYVVGLVPPAFLDQVSAAPGAQAKAARAKADTLILVNLTPAGWTVASGQLEAFTTGTNKALLGATNLLTNINPNLIPGARFCIGYGESASDMLSTGTIRDFLSLEGAPANAFGLPCLLSGVYVEGPPTSQQGTAVPMRAVVVGQSPTGSVRFRERFNDISADLALAPVNNAVAQATLNFTPPGAGEYAFGASYPGDGLNAAATSEVPLRHVVRAVQAATSTQIAGPVSTEIGMEVRLVAFVSGNRPGGSVQFKRGGVNEGGPVPVIDDQAVLSVVGLGIGDYSFTAVYSGDGANQPSTSPAFAHKVLDVATSEAGIASSGNPVPMGSPLTLTVTVTGTNPTGTVTLREDATVVGTLPISNGVASFPLPGLSAGVHVFAADYSGDANNPKASSGSLFQQVSLAGSPVTLATIKSGSGAGTVASSPSGIDCGAACAAQFLWGSTVTLTAAASAGSVFTGWIGSGCGGTGACTVPISGATTVTASFVPLAGVPTATANLTSMGFGSQSMQTTSPAQIVTLTNTGTGSITVTGIGLSEPQFSQSNTCSAALVTGASCTVTITFNPVTVAGALNSSVAVTGTLSIQTSAGAQAVSLSGTAEKSLVAHYYRSALRRAPDAGGKAFWEGEASRMVALGVNVNEAWYSMAGAFYTSAEYLAFARDNTGFVTDLYNTFFNRAPDAGGLAFWKGQLDSGMPREVALASFMFSPEFVNFTQAIFGVTSVRAEINTVVDFYRGLLARLPDNGGFAFWVQQFRTAQCQGASAVTAQTEAISSAFALSPEFSARNRNTSQYVGDLYNAFLRRGGDLPGVQFWINQIATSAQSREQVRQQFVASPEFQGRVAAIIAQGCLPAVSPLPSCPVVRPREGEDPAWIPASAGMTTGAGMTSFRSRHLVTGSPDGER